MLFSGKLGIATAFVLAVGLLVAGGVGVTQYRSSGAAEAQTGEGPQPVDFQKRIERLITQLGSPRFSSREAATRDLARIGKAALPSLRKAAKSNDPEVRRRAQTVINLLIPRRDSISLLSVNGNTLVPLKGNYDQILIADVNGNGRVEATDLDAGEIWIGAVNGNARVRLKGKARKLRIGPVNGDSQIDASELLAGEVEVAEINGSPRIQLLSSGGARFTGELNGSASTAVKAQGDIRFTRGIRGGSRVELATRGNVRLDDRVDGGARLTVLLARDVMVQGRIGSNVTIDASYFGEAKCVGLPGATIRLKKIAKPQ